MVLYLMLHFFTKRYFPASWHKIYLTVTIFLFIIPFPYFFIDYATFLKKHLGMWKQYEPGTMLDESDNAILVYKNMVYVRNLWFYIALLGGLLMSCFFLVVLIRRYRQVYIGIVGSSCKKQSIREVLSALHEKTGIRTEADVYVCKGLNTPVTVGILHRKIILPDITWTDEQLMDVFHHELIHIKSMDNLTKWLLLLAVILNFYNPLVYYLFYRWNLTSEMYCDDRVIGQKSNIEIKSYANLIIDFAEDKNHINLPIVGLSISKRQMKERIKNMKRKGKKYGIVSRVLGATIILAMMFASSLTTLAYEERRFHYYDDYYDGGQIDTYFVVEGDVMPFELDMKLKGYEDYIVADHDTFFVDEDGNVYYDIFTDTDEIRNYSECNHTYTDGTYLAHDKNDDGECNTDFTHGKCCTQCGCTILAEHIATSNYDVCLH